MPLDIDINENEVGHLLAHEQLHDFFNDWENYGPASFLKLIGGVMTGAITLPDGGSAISTVFSNKFAGLDGFEPYTPTLTADTNPTLGTGSRSIGYRAKIGKLGIGFFGIRFGTTGQNRGAGVYQIAMPYTLAGLMRSGGMTSDFVGLGTLWRGFNSLDLGAGTHPILHFHTAGTDNTKVLGVVQGVGSFGSDVEEVRKTSHQTAIGTSPTDVSTLTLSVVPPRRGARYKVSADVLVCKSGGTATDPMFVQITDSAGAVLGNSRRGCHAAVLGSTGFGTGLVPVHLEFIDENPAIGATRTYKVQVYTSASTMEVFGSSDAASVLRYEELPSMSTSGLDEPPDYLSATYPWYWDDGTAGPEIWGILFGMVP